LKPPPQPIAPKPPPKKPPPSSARRKPTANSAKRFQSLCVVRVGGALRAHIRTVFRTPPEVWVYRDRGRGRTMGDTTQPIGADHGPTRTVPTSVSAVASLHARPWRLADAASGADRHRVTVGAACGVATLGRAAAACDARCPGRFH